MIVEEFSVPDGEHADYLLAGLSRVIELRGVETFVAAPLLLPEPRFFPDPVEPRAQGVATLIRRLLAYARLEPRLVAVDVADDPHAVVLRPGHEVDVAGAAAWFIGIDEGVYRFGVRESVLTDEEGLIGVLGHEVAHAYRAHHHLEVTDAELEEKLTDLTTVYLGFGIFTLEARFRFRTGRYAGPGQVMLYEKQIHGYLSAGELALLVAAQLVARNQDQGDLERIAGQLAPNQGGALRDAYRTLVSDRASLLERLRLPPEQAWPAPVALSDALVPLAEATVDAHDLPEERRAREEQQRVGFRVAGNLGVTGTLVGGALGFGIAALTGLRAAFWPVTVGATALGCIVGRALKIPSCSGCGRMVKARATQCSTCSLKLVGDIDEITERMAAEEAYRAKASSLPGIRCPACGFRPSIHNRWVCSCEYRWCTFETRGRCPACDRQWLETVCLRCHERSPHGDWYEASVDEPA